MPSKPRILVVDDGLTYAQVIARQMPEFQLVGDGEPAAAPRLQSGPAALEFLTKNAGEVDVVLLDMHFDIPENDLFHLPEAPTLRRRKRFQGLAILRAIRQQLPDLPVVLLTSVQDLSLGDVGSEVAAQSMTYFLDDDDLDSLRIRIHAALREAQEGVEEAGILWGASPVMRALRRRLAVVARGRMPVILEGETGTGKSFLAEQFIHGNSERRGPFVTLDLSAIPQDLVAAHLFGAVRGAYTGAVSDRKGVFEMADGGTLFMDEVQNIPLDVQKQLLMVLQDRRVRPLGSTRELAVDVKVVAASNRPLAQAVARGLFRRDLYMRLSPATLVTIPPLRERPEDLWLLTKRLVAQAAEEPGNIDLKNSVASAVGADQNKVMGVATGRGGLPAGALGLILPGPAWAQLETHTWPGNVRELAMVLNNLVTFTLVEAVDALRAGLPLRSRRLQADTGLLATLLAGYAAIPTEGLEIPTGPAMDPDAVIVNVRGGETLNAVSCEVERQYMVTLFKASGGDFERMAERLLGDPEKGRAVRLRFNQLGLKVRELR